MFLLGWLYEKTLYYLSKINLLFLSNIDIKNHSNKTGLDFNEKTVNLKSRIKNSSYSKVFLSTAIVCIKCLISTAIVCIKLSPDTCIDVIFSKAKYLNTKKMLSWLAIEIQLKWYKINRNYSNFKNNTEVTMTKRFPQWNPW